MVLESRKTGKGKREKRAKNQKTRKIKSYKADEPFTGKEE